MSDRFDRNWAELVARAKGAPEPAVPEPDLTLIRGRFRRTIPSPSAWQWISVAAALLTANALVVPWWNSAWHGARDRASALLARPVPRAPGSRAPGSRAPQLPHAPGMSFAPVRQTLSVKARFGELSAFGFSSARAPKKETRQ